MLIDYAHAYHDAKIRYKFSNTQLYINYDAAYLVLPKARSRGAGYFYLSDKLNNTSQIPKPNPNGPILTECITLRNIMSSIAEERFSTIHGNGKLAISVRTDIVEIGHP